MSTKDVKLDSGADLKITMASFAEARGLYQSVLKEVKFLKIEDQAEIDVNFFKDIFCTLLSSKEIEQEIWNCMGRATYNKQKITEDTFSEEVARGDYISICYEIAWYNISPFTKGLYAKFSPLLGKAKNFLS